MQLNKRNNQNSTSKRQDNYMKSGDTKYRTTWTCMDTRGEIGCSGRAFSAPHAAEIINSKFNGQLNYNKQLMEANKQS